MNQIFKLGNISTEFYALSRKIIMLLEQDTDLVQYSNNIQTQLQELDKERLLKIAFIGQYSAGKSTIISALTGHSDIKINSDIATDVASTYDWNGNLLVDTPGLCTDRPEHDQITIEAIKTSDLLVFVITSDLFDDIILSNFVNLTYAQGYYSKMMIVLNKMGMEAGEFGVLVKNYTASLQDALVPYNLSDFPLSFVDAEDYRDGHKYDDPELVEMSNFSDFIRHLNQFVDEKGVLGKLDTPIRVVISEIDNAVVTKSGSDNIEFFQLLDRLQKRVLRNLKSAENECKLIIAKLRQVIVSKGSNLAGRIGDPDGAFEADFSKAEMDIEQEVLKASENLERSLVEKREELAEDCREIFESDLGEYYLEQVAANELPVGNVEMRDNAMYRQNFDSMTQIANRVSSGIVRFSIGTDGVQSVDGFLKAGQVAGSSSHKVVYGAGKLLGVKFKPWQAVKISQKLANVAKVVGPVLSVVSLVIDVVDIQAQKEQSEKIMQAKSQCVAEFIGMADDLETQLREAFEHYRKEFYTDILHRIATTRSDAMVAEQRVSIFVDDITGYKNELLRLIDSIYN